MAQANAGQSSPMANDQAQVDQFQSSVDATAQSFDAIAGLLKGFGDPAAAQTVQAMAQSIESTPVAVGGGGGYRVSPSDLEAQLAQCAVLIGGLRGQARLGTLLIAACNPPARDSASVPMASAISKLGTQMEQRVQNQISFIENWQRQLQQVRQNYLEQEGHTVATWKALSGGLYDSEPGS
jgi:hypothetical protein